MGKEYRVVNEYGREIGRVSSKPSSGELTGSLVGLLILWVGSIFVGPYIFIKGKLLHRWDEIGVGTKVVGILTSIGWGVYTGYLLTMAGVGKDQIPFLVIICLLEFGSLLYIIVKWLNRASADS